ncbi:hypothetical protein COLO4_16005 [Corchorus olitorius]|uniref:Uncharacterized protein n=1 Tax=Corchorus olitorius TaxID=93759 RepID=A0A1R3JKH8_9ROSI|nr:hypothetical protein COLO4_16005 [Corchorus olitorius]
MARISSTHLLILVALFFTGPGVSMSTMAHSETARKLQIMA